MSVCVCMLVNVNILFYFFKKIQEEQRDEIEMSVKEGVRD